MPWALTTQRRYYLRAATNYAAESEYDQSKELVGQRNARTGSALPAKLPHKKKLQDAVDPDLLECLGIKVPLYVYKEDLTGADAEELTDWAGLSEEEAAEVVAFLETL